MILELSKFTLGDNEHGEIPTIPTRLHDTSKAAAEGRAPCGVVGLINGMRGCAAALQGAMAAGVVGPGNDAALIELMGAFFTRFSRVFHAFFTRFPTNNDDVRRLRAACADISDAGAGREGVRLH